MCIVPGQVKSLSFIDEQIKAKESYMDTPQIFDFDHLLKGFKSFLGAFAPIHPDPTYPEDCQNHQKAQSVPHVKEYLVKKLLFHCNLKSST